MAAPLHQVDATSDARVRELRGIDAHRNVGAVLQDMPGDFPLSVRDVVAMGRSAHKKLFQPDNAHDRALMTEHRIDAVISKNSGGSAAYGKIAAARGLGIEAIMIRRRAVADAPAVATIDEAVAWLDHALTSATARGV